MIRKGEVGESVAEEDPLAFDEERQALAKRHQRESLALGLAGLGLFLAAAWVVLPTGLSAWLAAWASAWTTNPWLVVALYVLVAYGALTVLALPLRLLGRLSELRFGLSKQSWGSWAGDRLKGVGLGIVFTLLTVEALYWTLRAFGPWWWLVFAGLTVAFTVVAGYVAPVVLLPLFYPVRPVEDPDLEERLRATCRQAGIRPLGVYEFQSSAKTERGTAALAGLGRTKRILLSDHILEHFAPEEVEGILAHELAHEVQHDTFLYLGLSGLLALVGLFLTDLFVRWGAPLYGFRELADVGTLPLFALFSAVFYNAVGPAMGALSRRREAAADRRGAALAGNPRALASALVKLHDRNLADAAPHPVVEVLIYTHPPGRKRVEALRRLAERESA